MSENAGEIKGRVVYEISGGFECICGARFFARTELDAHTPECLHKAIDEYRRLELLYRAAFEYHDEEAIRDARAKAEAAWDRANSLYVKGLD